MNAFTPHSPEAAPSAESRQELLLDRQLEMLGRLAEVGLQIAEAVGRHVAAMADAAPIPSPDQDDASAERRVARLNAGALAYGRAARAVRMTLALQAKLAKAPTAAAEASGPTVKFGWMEDPAQVRQRRAIRVRRLVRRVAEAASLELEAVERLCAEAAERLDDEDLYGDLLGRPLGEVLAHICRDLGLDPDWGRLAEEPWARDEIASGATNSPFAAFMAPGRQTPQSREPDG